MKQRLSWCDEEKLLITRKLAQKLIQSLKLKALKAKALKLLKA